MASKGPVRLADSSADGEIRLNPEATEVLARLPQPLKVVSIFGPSQSGKSYLLNLLTGSNEFIVSSDSSKKNPCIYMRCLPDPLDSEQTLVLLDCEGFEEDLVLEPQPYSPIFTLSVLLSSVFLYNTFGPVRRETLDQLFHITMLKNILPFEDHVNGRFLPEFVWCVRDESLIMNFAGIELVSEDFLDSVLNDIEDDNSPARKLQEIFTRPKMKLFDFCTPHACITDHESLSLSDLSPDFITQIDALRNFLYRSKPKAFLDGRYSSGRELVNLLEMFEETVSKGSIMNLNQVSDISVLEVSGKDSSGDLPEYLPLVKSSPPGNLLSGPKLSIPGREECFSIPAREECFSIPAREECFSIPAREECFSIPARASVFSSSGKMLEPICLIENTTNNELNVNQEAVDILSSFSHPVVVVSIVGMYRTGKSYLMNRLAGQHKGFALGSTIQSKTKGIWMWCVPVPGREEQTLVLLDTEGLGDVEKGNEKNDHWIFSLAVLLSCTLIYNSIGTINNVALMNLQYVTELTKHIKVKSSDEDEAEASAEYMGFFPSFIWAVRDFTLDLEADGKPITADEYLENSLKPKSVSINVSASNSARHCIRNYFPRRKCFVFDMPVHKDKLKIIDQLSDSDLEEKFVKQATEFCSYVHETSQVKTIKGGIKVTGSLLANLVMMYVETIRSGKVPCLENAVVALAQIENSKAVEQAHNHYKQLLSRRIELHTETQEALSNVHESCLKEALHLFLDRSFKDDDRRFQTKLMELIKNEYDKKCQENEELSLNYCTALLMQLEENALKPDNDYMRPGGYQDFQQDLNNLILQYRGTGGKGIKAEHTLEDYLATKNELGKMVLVADRSLSEQQKRVEEQKAYAKMQKVKAKAAKVEKEAMERRVQDVMRAQEENKRQLMDKIERERRDMQSEHERVLQQKLKEQSAMLQQGFNNNVHNLQREIDHLRYEMNREQSRSSGSGWCTIS